MSLSESLAHNYRIERDAAARTFHARCSCGWKGYERVLEAQAERSGREHIARVAGGAIH